MAWLKPCPSTNHCGFAPPRRARTPVLHQSKSVPKQIHFTAWRARASAPHDPHHTIGRARTPVLHQSNLLSAELRSAERASRPLPHVRPHIESKPGGQERPPQTFVATRAYEQPLVL